MALTRSFKNTILARAESDIDFRREMLINAINELIAGDIQIAKEMLRDYINASISFEPLALELHRNSKSLQRMLGPKGNPTTKSLFEMIHLLQANEGIKLKVHISNDRSH